jgi:hypothetical protein
MDTFRIAASGPASGLRFRSTTVDTHLDPGGAATAKVTVDKGVTNPLYVATTGALSSGIFRPELFSSSKSSTVAGSAALDDAVAALHALGDAHGVTGINLSTGSSRTGGVMFADQPGMFQSGGPTTERVGKDNLRSIDDAARQVLQIATAG